MKTKFNIKRIGLVLMVLAMMFAVPSAYAFEERTGDTITIKAGEVIEDDLYVAAETIIVDGTIKGDLFAVGNTIKINGTVEGDLVAAAQTVIIEGTVGDDVRIAGAALELGREAVVGDDLIGLGASLYTAVGSVIEGDIVFAGAQTLLEGKVGGDALLAGAGISLQGDIGGDVKVDVGDSSAGDMPVNPLDYIPEMPNIPSVATGFTLGDRAEIGGELKYISLNPIDINPGQVMGGVEYEKPAVNVDVPDVQVNAPRIVGQGWLLTQVRRFVSVVIVGMLMAWIAPRFIKALAGELESQPGPSVGWGAVTYFGFPIAWFITAGLVVFLAIVLGLVSLGSLVGTILGLGFGTLGMLFTLFIFALSYLTKIVVGYWLGKLVLKKLNDNSSQNIFVALLIGLAILVFLRSIPLIGFLFNFTTMLFGLGTIWLYVGKWWKTRSTGKLAPVSDGMQISAKDAFSVLPPDDSNEE